MFRVTCSIPDNLQLKYAVNYVGVNLRFGLDCVIWSYLSTVTSEFTNADVLSPLYKRAYNIIKSQARPKSMSVQDMCDEVRYLILFNPQSREKKKTGSSFADSID